jgi:hypothetical protein
MVQASPAPPVTASRWLYRSSPSLHQSVLFSLSFRKLLSTGYMWPGHTSASGHPSDLPIVPLSAVLKDTTGFTWDVCQAHALLCFLCRCPFQLPTPEDLEFLGSSVWSCLTAITTSKWASSQLFWTILLSSQRAKSVVENGTGSVRDQICQFRTHFQCLLSSTICSYVSLGVRFGCQFSWSWPLSLECLPWQCQINTRKSHIHS